MQAWELLKHLDEGGQLIRDRDTYRLTNGVLEYKVGDNWLPTVGGLEVLVKRFDLYKIVVPKRKTVVEAWVDFGDAGKDSELYNQLGIAGLTCNLVYSSGYDSKVRITLEEL